MRQAVGGTKQVPGAFGVGRISWTIPQYRFVFMVPCVRGIVGAANWLRHVIFWGSAQSGDGWNIRKLLSVQEAGSVDIKGSDVATVILQQGFAHARERLLQMDISRRCALGRLSEVLGDEALGLDKASRVLGIARAAEEDERNLSDFDMGLLRSYANGVNSYIRSEKFVPPFSYCLIMGWQCFWKRGGHVVDEWLPIHSLAILRLYAHELSHGSGHDLASILMTGSYGEAMSPRKHGDPLVSSPQEGVTSIKSYGGMAWATAAFGKSFVTTNVYANTPVELSLANWYMNTLHSANGFNVTGASLPGVPLVMVGSNSHISWGMTASAIPTEQIFAAFALSHPSEEGTGDMGSVNHIQCDAVGAGARVEIIKIRRNSGLWAELYHGIIDGIYGSSLTSISVQYDEETLLVRDTVDGPIVTDDLSSSTWRAFYDLKSSTVPSAHSDITSPPRGKFDGLALRSDALRERISLEFLWGLNTASDWVSFSSAAATLRTPSLNILYADRRGNIGYSITGGSSVGAFFSQNSKDSRMMFVNRSSTTNSAGDDSGITAPSHVIILDDSSSMVTSSVMSSRVASEVSQKLNHSRELTDKEALHSFAAFGKNAFSPSASVLKAIFLEAAEAVVTSVLSSSGPHDDTAGNVEEETHRRNELILKAGDLLRDFNCEYQSSPVEAPVTHPAAAVLLESFRLELKEVVSQEILHGDEFGGQTLLSSVSIARKNLLLGTSFSVLPKVRDYFREDAMWAVDALQELSFQPILKEKRVQLITQAALTAYQSVAKTYNINNVVVERPHTNEQETRKKPLSLWQMSPIAWGRIHASSIPHPVPTIKLLDQALASTPIPSAGTVDSVFRSGYGAPAKSLDGFLSSEVAVALGEKRFRNERAVKTSLSLTISGNSGEHSIAFQDSINEISSL